MSVIISLFGFSLIAFGKNNLILTILGLMIINSLIPLLNSVNRSLFQLKIPENLHGRFFSIRRSISHSTAPLSIIIFSFMVDSVNKATGISGFRLIFIIGTIGTLILGLMMKFSKKYITLPMKI